MRLGKAFSDFVSIEKSSKKTKGPPVLVKEKSGRWRLYLPFLLVLMWFIILEARLFHLTVVKGSRNRRLSEANRVREQLIHSPRGIIFDRNGYPLVRNVPLFILVDRKCQQSGKCKQLSADEVLEQGFKSDDPSLRLRVGRFYPEKDAFAHLLGYVGEVGEEELLRYNRDCDQNRYCRVGLGELVGRGGVEEFWDELLRGVAGRELVEVDALGEPIRVLGRSEPRKGENLTLSVDRQLQKLAANILASQAGAIIASQPDSGEILTMVSAPSFDPNLFAQGKVETEEVIERSDQPLFNRAISGLYPPGSTFKLITAVAGLEGGKITATTEFEDIGEIRIGPYSYSNWYFSQYGKTEGFISIVKALARSNDIFFYRVGERVGIENLANWTRRFGVGRQLGIDLPGEEEGIVPDPSWKQENKGESWFLGDTYHVAIGQGGLLVTPLQVNFWTDVIANGGKLCRPRVVKSQEPGARSQECQDLGIAKKTIDLVREGMRKACQPGGTGWPLFKFKVQSEKLTIDGVNFLESPIATVSGKPWVEIPVACKTGTAEFGDPKGRTHAWFTVFAPVENPQISITVLIEAGGEGSYVAAPVAKKLLEFWFTQ